MSQDDQQPKPTPPVSGGVRRVGRKDRKDKLRRRRGVVPPPDDARFAPPDLQPPDLSDVFAPDTPPKAVTPTAERFPPVAPPRDAPPVSVELPTDSDDEPTLPPPPNSSATTTPRTRKRDVLANLLTGVLMLLMLGAAGFFVYAWQNPYSPLNPLALPTPLPIVITATFLPPTDTPAPTLEPTMTFTPLAAAVNTPTPLGQTAETAIAYLLGQVRTQPNANGRGCAWSSVAGEVTDADGEPVDGIAVRITATAPTGDDIEADYETVYTGSTLSFGAGGFERPLGAAPPAEDTPYWLQLFDAQGMALSEPIAVMVSSLCEQNVTFVGFGQAVSD